MESKGWAADVVVVAMVNKSKNAIKMIVER